MSLFKMKKNKNIGTIIFSLLFSVNINSQGIYTQINGADSVFLISHTGKAIIKKSEPVENYELIIDQKLNYKLVKEKVLVQGKNLKQLANIVSGDFKDSLIEYSCFCDFKQAIIIYKNNKLSFIDISFGQRDIQTSDDIEIKNRDFDNATWDKLKLFFRKMGLKLGLRKY